MRVYYNPSLPHVYGYCGFSLMTENECLLNEALKKKIPAGGSGCSRASFIRVDVCILNIL